MIDDSFFFLRKQDGLIMGNETCIKVSFNMQPSRQGEIRVSINRKAPRTFNPGLHSCRDLTIQPTNQTTRTANGSVLAPNSFIHIHAPAAAACKLQYSLTSVRQLSTRPLISSSPRSSSIAPPGLHPKTTTLRPGPPLCRAAALLRSQFRSRYTPTRQPEFPRAVPPDLGCLCVHLQSLRK